MFKGLKDESSNSQGFMLDTVIRSFPFPFFFQFGWRLYGVGKGSITSGINYNACQIFTVSTEVRYISGG